MSGRINISITVAQARALAKTFDGDPDDRDGQLWERLRLAAVRALQKRDRARARKERGDG